MTIEQILNKYSECDYDKITLDYEGDIEVFNSEYDLDDCLMDEEATAKIFKRNLIIKVRN